MPGILLFYIYIVIVLDIPGVFSGGDTIKASSVKVVKFDNSKGFINSITKEIKRNPTIKTTRTSD